MLSYPTRGALWVIVYLLFYSRPTFRPSRRSMAPGSLVLDRVFGGRSVTPALQ